MLGEEKTHHGPPDGREIVVPDVFARVQAYLIDNLVLIVPCVMEWFLLRFWLEGMDYFGINLFRYVFEVFGLQLAVGPLGIVFPLLMSPNLFVLEVITAGRTPGKKLGGLRVVSRSGGGITVKQAFLRNLLRLVDMLPAYYLFGIATMASDRLRRRIWDKVANTVVIVDREDIFPFMKEPVKRVA